MIVILILLGIIALGVVAGFIVYKEPKVLRYKETEQAPPVSIIIPARNEEKNLPTLLKSLKEQNHEIEIIVVNDGSEDNTKEVIKSFNAKEITITENPWHGKSYVCFTGAQHASHELIMFLDADTVLEHNNAISNVTKRYELQRYNGILSLQPFHRTKTIREQLSFIFNLVTVMGINAFSWIKPARKITTVFGPVVMTNKTDYIKTGGHSAAKEHILDGEGLLEAYKANGLPVTLTLGYKNISVRMYPNGLSEVIMGWMKHISTGAAKTHPVNMMLIIMMIGGGFVALLTLLYVVLYAQEYILWGVIAYIFYGLAIGHYARRIIHVKWYDIVLYPLYILFFITVFGLSILMTNVKKEVVWKGRRIKLK